MLIVDDDIVGFSTRVKRRVTVLLKDEADRESKRVGGKVGIGEILQRAVFQYFGEAENGDRRKPASRARKRSKAA